MATKNSNPLLNLLLFITGILLISFISSCGKQGAASPTGLNVQYDLINLSPDLSPVNLFIGFKQANTNPFVFNVDQGYFYLPSIDTPFQIRSALVSGTVLFTRSDVLQPGLKYTLYITGNEGNQSLAKIFTVDTASLPAVGRGKVRFVNASPTATSGLDVYANGTQAFSKILYTNYSKFLELPVGNYDFQIDATGSTNILKDMPGTTIQDGRVYTIYAYGYTNRVDSAAFSAAVIQNQ
jgi:hypothetical protein